MALKMDETSVNDFHEESPQLGVPFQWQGMIWFVSYLNSHLGYSAEEFQALQLIVLAVFGAVD